jgi:glycosyltransferase involved in cell wall biosynthesis
MRIVVDYRPALRARTGVGEYIRQLVRAYAAAHHDDVTVFTSSWKDRPDSGLASELGAEVIDRKVPVSVLNYSWHRLGMPPIELLTGRADVVHAAHPLLIPARSAAQVVTIHDLFFLDYPERTHAEIRRDYSRYAGDHARRADAIVTSSRHTGRLLTERFQVSENHIYYCPPGAPSWQTLGHTPNVPRDGYILFLGTLEPRKNVGTLLDAFAQLVRRTPSAPRLVLAGGIAPGADEWLARLSVEPLKGHVEYVGYVADPNRERLLAGARALVLPSLDEGFGLTALEAMSAGVPVLSSNRGSLPEVVGSGGTLLDACDADAWSTAIERAATDSHWATAQGQAGLERAKAFTWTAAADRLRQAYVDAVSRRQRR